MHDHISDALATLHWLHIPERVQHKVAMLTYKLLHGSAPRYLGPLVAVADLPGRRTLQSARNSHLVVPPIKLSTIGRHAFPVAAAQVWILEQSARGRRLIVITADCPSSFNNSPFSIVDRMPRSCLTACVLSLVVIAKVAFLLERGLTHTHTHIHLVTYATDHPIHGHLLPPITSMATTQRSAAAAAATKTN